MLTAITVQDSFLLLPVWKYGKWSRCSAVCDLGFMTRTVTCANDTHTLDLSECGGGDTSVTMSCMIKPCYRELNRKI